MTSFLTSGDSGGLSDRLLGFVLEELGKIETANSMTLRDAKDEPEDKGGRFAETLEDYESVEGMDLVVDDTMHADENEGGLSKPIKVKKFIDERSLEHKMYGPQHELVWDSRRKCYVKRRRTTP